jgi:DNA polymerase III epsilon subunit-like protein
MEAYARYIKNYSDYHNSFTWVKLSEAAANEGVQIDLLHRSLADSVLCARLIKKIISG